MAEALLNYEILTAPDPIETNVDALLTLIVKPVDNRTIYCKKITVEIPAGNSEDTLCRKSDLSSSQLEIIVPLKIEMKAMTAAPPKPKPWKEIYYVDAGCELIENEMEIEIEVSKVNQYPGKVEITLTEYSSEDGVDYSNKEKVITIEKVPFEFYVENFISAKPTADSEKLQPCTEFKNGEPVHLCWEGSAGTDYSLFVGSTEFEKEQNTTHVFEKGLNQNTSIILKGRNGEKELFKTLNVIITNPDVTPSTIKATETVEASKFVCEKISVTGIVEAEKYIGDGIVPKGAILMWHGKPESVPSGWALCDGSNGTPDLRGRFILGTGRGTGQRKIGQTSGQETVKLDVKQMPEHEHGISINTMTVNQPRFIDDRIVGGWPETMKRYCYTHEEVTLSPTCTIDKSGKGEAHDNMPPYYVLAFIMKL